MSKYVNITVSTSLSTDFIIEVPDNASVSQIKELAEKEVILPHNYPSFINNILKTRMGIQVNGLDSMLRSWNLDEINYIVDDGGNSETSVGEPLNA